MPPSSCRSLANAVPFCFSAALVSSSHASAPLVGHTQSTPASALAGKVSAHDRGDAQAVFAAASSTDIGIAAALPSVSNAQPW